MRAIVWVLLLGLSGCASYGLTPVQPRALLWGASQPWCLFWCTQTVSVTSGEQGASPRGGDVTVTENMGLPDASVGPKTGN